MGPLEGTERIAFCLSDRGTTNFQLFPHRERSFFSDSDKLSRERTWFPWEGLDAEKAALESFYLLHKLTLQSVPNR